MKKEQEKENPILNLVINIVIPALVMIKGNKWFNLTPEYSLIIALIFPFFYGLYDLVIKKKFNFLSIIGFISILLTGGIGLFKLPKDWIAFKEGAVPLVIGVAIILSLKTRYPLVRTFLYNDKIINVEKVNQHLDSNGNTRAFDQLLIRCTWLIASSFLLSTLLNFSLAKILIQSDTGTQAFTEELGQMTAWSYFVIGLPCTIIMMLALWQLFKGIQNLTGLKLEEVFQGIVPEKEN